MSASTGIEGELRDLFAGRGAHLGRLTHLLCHHHGAAPAVDDPAPTPGLHPGGVRTHEDLEDAVARLAAAFRGAGMSRGDRVLVLVGNRIDVLLHAFAIARLGGVAAPVNPRLRTGELVEVATAIDARHVVADRGVIDRIAGALPASISILPTQGAESVQTWLVDHPDDRVAAPEDLDRGDVALLLTTSGTTGVPKAAALTSHGLLQAPGKLGRLPERMRTGRTAVAALPLAHVMGLGNVLGMLCAGFLLVHRERFEPEAVLDLIEEHRPSMFYGVPTMYADLEAAGAAERDLSSIHLFGSGADAMPPERARRFQGFGSAAIVRGRPVGKAAFADSYGMVELSGAGAVRFYLPGPRRLRSATLATVVPGLQARAVDEAGRPVRAGRVGELQFRGTVVLERYEGHPDAGPDADGWFSSGDHARVWPGGLFFTFAGRRKDRLKVGGFSVFPAEVEAALGRHPDVAEVAVVGLPDERLGERLVALVVPRAAGFDHDAFLDWARREVAGYRCPHEVLVVDGIPRGNNAKVDRLAATELALAVSRG